MHPTPQSKDCKQVIETHVSFDFSFGDMSNRSKGKKPKIQGSKPELPSFLQKIKQQIVENEDADRREESEKKRLRQSRSRTTNDDDDPTIVQIDKDDLTEAEYKRMKRELETSYKVKDEASKVKPTELDIDDMIKTRVQTSGKSDDRTTSKAGKTSQSSTKDSKKPAKKLSYDSSSSGEE